MGVGPERPVCRDAVDSLDFGYGRINDLLDPVGWQSLLGTVPSACTPQSQAGVVNLVIDIDVVAVGTPVHPNEMGVAGGVD